MPVDIAIEGPHRAGARGRPFGAALVDLERHGYVEEEYILSGDATRFRLRGTEYRVDGKWTVEAAGEAPFRTRMLVRRPLDAARFNGTVVVGWTNVSHGYESVGGENAELLRDGYAFAGVSAQRVGVHGLPFGQSLGLVAWDEARYGRLSIPNDDWSYDIFTRAANTVAPDRTGVLDPLAGLPVQRLVAWGRSQSAIRLATYYNAIQPTTRRFDGFLVEVYHCGGAMVSSLSPGDPVPEIPEPMVPIVQLLPYGCHRLRDDVEWPVLVVNSETETTPCAKVRQPDTATYRLWEVAGAAHVGGDARARITARQQFEFGGAVPEPWDTPADANTLSMDAVYDAALHHMQRWIVDGTPPPSLPRIDVDGSPPVIVRDEHGIARGGIRLPQVAVPTAMHAGASPPGTTPNLFGRSVPFGGDELARLYPDADSYRVRFAAAVQAAVDAGVVLPGDAEQMIHDAGRYVLAK